MMLRPGGRGRGGVRGGRPESHPGPSPARGAARGVPAASPLPASASWGDEMLANLERGEDDNGERLRWFVFHCTRATEFACLERLVFATHDNATNRKKVKKIRSETELYLFNVDTKKTHGRFFPARTAWRHRCGAVWWAVQIAAKSRTNRRCRGCFSTATFWPQTHEPPCP